ncbi:hypothetical protein RND81_02G065800 [Saponaria officinalis]|uniref:GDSL esterase/lipase EXL3 n=1 Tax=Saponaria officinalis TaxID=3572 RepID=A0AAW1MT58_SAPOF
MQYTTCSLLFSCLSITLLVLPFNNVFVASLPINLPPNTTVPAVFGFGDSIIDPGNNNNINTAIKCNFPPYGQDFMGGVSTGRFSNGKIPTDFIAEIVGVKETVPAYLDPSISREDLLTGVSFASGGSGYDPLTTTIVSVISLEKQLENFKEYKGRVTKMVGEEKTEFIVSNSLYFVVAGSDDIANTYYSTPTRRLHYDVDAYTSLLASSASSFLQSLYKVGARRIAAFSAPPIGCVPSQRTLGGGITRNCADDYNNAAQLFNSKLSSALDSLATKFSDAKFVYIDIYNPLLDSILHPSNYGFKEVTKGCCGTGLIEVTLLCNKFDAVCADDTKYLFWDSYHPTERGYEILCNQLIPKYISRLL